MDNFNFLLDPEVYDPPKSPPNYVGPNLNKLTKMTPKEFAVSVLEVYEQLGGASWLLIEAKSNPRAFLDLLKKMIPSGIQMDDLHGFSIRLIDQFGNEVRLEKPGSTPLTATNGNHEINDEPAGLERSGQPETATGGNPNHAVGVGCDENKVNIQDTFDD